MRHTDIFFFTLVDTVLHSVACVRSWKAPQVNRSHRKATNLGAVHLNGAIAHSHLQRPVPKGFPLFKRCEWLVAWLVTRGHNWLCSAEKAA